MKDFFDMFYEATGIDLLLLLPLVLIGELLIVFFMASKLPFQYGERQKKIESIENTKNNRTSDVSDVKNDKVSLIKKDDANVVDISDDLKKYYDYEVVENDEQNKIK